MESNITDQEIIINQLEETIVMLKNTDNTTTGRLNKMKDELEGMKS